MVHVLDEKIGMFGKEMNWLTNTEILSKKWLKNKQMSGRQVAVARAPVKRQSKNRVRESTGDLSADDHASELIAEERITKSQFKCGKNAWKIFNHSLFNCATIICGRATAHSGLCNCGDLTKEEFNSGLPLHAREFAKTTVKVTPNIAQAELRNDLVVEVMSGESVTQHHARNWLEHCRKLNSKNLL